jgi:hypothetical protein
MAETDITREQALVVDDEALKMPPPGRLHAVITPTPSLPMLGVGGLGVDGRMWSSVTASA